MKVGCAPFFEAEAAAVGQGVLRKGKSQEPEANFQSVIENDEPVGATLRKAEYKLTDLATDGGRLYLKGVVSRD